MSYLWSCVFRIFDSRLYEISMDVCGCHDLFYLFVFLQKQQLGFHVVLEYQSNIFLLLDYDTSYFPVSRI